MGFPILVTWILLRVPHTNNQDLQGLGPTSDLDLLRVPHTNSQDLHGVSHTSDLDFNNAPLTSCHNLRR